MEIKIQKERCVMNNSRLGIILLLFLISFTLSCSKSKNSEDELLKTYFENHIKKSKLDSIFLSPDNSNNEIYDRYTKLLKANTDLDSSLRNIISIDQNDNFKNQVIEGSKWELNLDNFDHVFCPDLTDDKKEILFLTKPIYTTDGKYALMYSYKKGMNGAYFLPPIEVYKFDEGKWVKFNSIVSKIYPTN